MVSISVIANPFLFLNKILLSIRKKSVIEGVSIVLRSVLTNPSNKTIQKFRTLHNFTKCYNVRLNKMLQNVVFCIDHGGNVPDEVVGGPVQLLELKLLHLIENIYSFGKLNLKKKYMLNNINTINNILLIVFRN